jgi:hypothetical protein
MFVVVPTILDFRRIVLNFIYFFGVLQPNQRLHLEFTLNFSTIFIGFFNIRASQKALPTEIRSPEIIDEWLRDPH